jgi:gamma-glutamylcyclotransferase (GGCT)/AIG2-like uncharacterized protein YtfP
MHAEQPSHIAFYGTLMSRFDALDQLQVRSLLRPLGPCAIEGRLFDLGDWPTLELGGGVVEGELLEVLDDAVFATLDPFEDYDPCAPQRSSYVRSAIWLLRPRLRAWVYVTNVPVPSEREIASGSWTALLAARAASAGALQQPAGDGA